MLGLHCCAGFSSCGKWELSLVVWEILIPSALFCRAPALGYTGSGVVVHRHGCHEVYAIFFALAGGFLTTRSPGKSSLLFFF